MNAPEQASPADLLRRHPAGVTVVTAPGPAGFTATSFTSVSLDPALVSFFVARTASAAPALRVAPVFAVHTLGGRQADLARRFARSGVDRFAGVDHDEGPQGVPILRDVPAWLVARVTHRQPIGDHLLVAGEVVDAGGPADQPGLAYFDGDFTVPVPLPRAAAQEVP
ncbi:MAG TPA: flavin reductase family protein [Pseudonocardia sp.]|nr:flavin reductase family protein [Pseudonocardia sp.]